MSLARAIYRQCPYCEGAGRILGEAQIWKRIKYAIIDELAKHPGTESAQILVHPQFRSYLQKEVLDDIRSISGQYQIALEFLARPDYHHEQFEIVRQAKSISNGNSEAPRRRRRPVKDKS
jgi:Ribonuclease G/E